MSTNSIPADGVTPMTTNAAGDVAILGEALVATIEPPIREPTTQLARTMMELAWFAPDDVNRDRAYYETARCLMRPPPRTGPSPAVASIAALLGLAVGVLVGLVLA